MFQSTWPGCRVCLNVLKRCRLHYRRRLTHGLSTSLSSAVLPVLGPPKTAVTPAPPSELLGRESAFRMLTCRRAPQSLLKYVDFASAIVETQHERRQVMG